MIGGKFQPTMAGRAEASPDRPQALLPGAGDVPSTFAGRRCSSPRESYTRRRGMNVAEPTTGGGFCHFDLG